jgi:hypothetical protein
MTRAEERAARFGAQIDIAQTPEQALAVAFAWLRGSAAHTSKRGHGCRQYGDNRDHVVASINSVTEILIATARELDMLSEPAELVALHGVRSAS